MDLPVTEPHASRTGPYGLAPGEADRAVVLASPHSGREYPLDFIASARLDPLALRRSEDSFVDELFAAAPASGIPLIAATFPRAFCDPNREPWELDPGMFEEGSRPGSTQPAPAWARASARSPA